ncbi:MAG: VWA domain-containing protein [Acidobacteriota bacterium]|nr:VWA domain-containing protein [Acidobacteriota bacterium]
MNRWVGFGLLLLLAPATSPQEVKLPDVFTEVIDVRVVNIEVVVTDADGIRVHGLGPGDFRLRVDGAPRPIEYFSEILGGESVGDSGALPGAPALAEGASTSYLVFIDDYFSIARDRNRVLGALIEDLDRLHARDRMAVVAFDGRGLELLSSWTQSRLELERALRHATERKSYGLHRMGELRASDRSGFGFRRGIGRLDPLERSYARRLAEQVERAVSAVVATLRSFASPPGRKVMILLNGGWPAAPAEFAVTTSRGSFGAAYAASRELIPRSATLLSPLADAANLLGYTLYPVDVPGMGSGFASDGGTGSGLMGREGQMHDSLSFLARETGGQPLYNSRRLSALETVSDDTRSYYWLGFSLDRAGDDSRHDVEVDVLRPGLEVRTREGFVDLSRRSEVTMVVESSLLFGHPASDRPLEVRFGKARKARRGIVEIPLEVGFALDDVTLLQVGPDAYGGEVEVRVTVMDESGYRSDTPVESVRIAGRERPEPGQMYWWKTTLLMRKRNHRVVVAVFDALSGAMFSSSAEIFP